MINIIYDEFEVFVLEKSLFLALEEWIVERQTLELMGLQCSMYCLKKI